MANGRKLSFLGSEFEVPQGGAGPVGPAEGAPASNVLQELLGQLEFAPQPEAPRTGIARGIGGALADALTQRARVLAGAAPLAQAPFAAEQARQRQVFEQQTLASETANRDIRNRLRIKGAEQKIRVIEEAKQRKQDIADDIEALKRQSDKELRRVLAREVTSRGLLPEGKNLLQMSTAELSDALSEQDPAAHLDAQLAALPEGFEVSFEIDEKGRVSIKGRPPSEGGGAGGAGKALPTGSVGLITDMIDKGSPSTEQVAVALGVSPDKARALQGVADESFKRTSQLQAKVALRNLSQIEHPPGTDPTISQISDQARDLLTIQDSGGSPQRIADYYFQQIDAGAELVESGALTVPQLTTIIENLIGMIERTFGEEVVQQIRSTKRGKRVEQEATAVRSGEASVGPR